MERPEINLIGRQFDLLTVRGKVGGKWLCDCRCGGTTIQDTYNLTHRRVISCGCSRKAAAAELNIRDKHNLREAMEGSEERARMLQGNQQAQSCRFAAKTSMSCNILKELYCQKCNCNFWKPREGEV